MIYAENIDSLIEDTLWVLTKEGIINLNYRAKQDFPLTSQHGKNILNFFFLNTSILFIPEAVLWW